MRFDPEGPGFSASTQLVFSRAAAGSPWSLTSQWDEPEDAGKGDFEAVERPIRPWISSKNTPADTRVKSSRRPTGWPFATGGSGYA